MSIKDRERGKRVGGIVVARLIGWRERDGKEWVVATTFVILADGKMWWWTRKGRKGVAVGERRKKFRSWKLQWPEVCDRWRGWIRDLQGKNGSDRQLGSRLGVHGQMWISRLHWEKFWGKRKPEVSRKHGNIAAAQFWHGNQSHLLQGRLSRGRGVMEWYSGGQHGFGALKEVSMGVDQVKGEECVQASVKCRRTLGMPGRKQW
jgi:hypothetical protein